MKEANEVTGSNSSDPPFYFTYTSANNLLKFGGVQSYSQFVNPKIVNFLKGRQGQEHLGCIVVDMITKDYARLIYALNFANSREMTADISNRSVDEILGSHKESWKPELLSIIVMFTLSNLIISHFYI